MSTYTSRTPIHKGWSEDQKYCLTAQDGSRVLLRVSPAGQLSRKEAEFRHMAQAAALGVPMCRPLELGVFSEGVYFLQSWIDGRDLEEVLPGQTGQAQYAWGLEAGSILRKLHTIPAPDTLEPWEVRFGRKLDRKIQGYLQCPLQYPGGQAFLNHVRENRHLLKNRPQTWQHGDYHTGNMMLGRDGTGGCTSSTSTAAITETPGRSSTALCGAPSSPPGLPPAWWTAIFRERSPWTSGGCCPSTSHQTPSPPSPGPSPSARERWTPCSARPGTFSGGTTE